MSCRPGRESGRLASHVWPGQATVAGSPTTAAQTAASSHSLRYFYTAVLEPSQGLPQFVQVGYVDSEPITHYDSSTRRKRPAAPWMEKVGEDDAQYWERGTQKLHKTEQMLRENLATLQKYYNQKGGLHTLQWMYGCELESDGSKGGYMQFGYDGSDYLNLDKEHLRWTAADATAQISKVKLEAEPAIAQRSKAYLEEECVEWLQRYLDYGKETLLRTGVTSSFSGSEMLDRLMGNQAQARQSKKCKNGHLSSIKH
uniref:MHC class I-like antigen recognition-like domain-containing protein n=1 Tax=Varanus komodoensis TaxID=61221 RepID=A0A8D2KRP9_VARKO